MIRSSVASKYIGTELHCHIDNAVVRAIQCLACLAFTAPGSRRNSMLPDPIRLLGRMLHDQFVWVNKVNNFILCSMVDVVEDSLMSPTNAVRTKLTRNRAL